MLNPFQTGFYTTLVLEGIENSLNQPLLSNNGVTFGSEVDLKDLLSRELGSEVSKNYHQ